MRHPFALLALLASPFVARATTVTVCASGCTYDNTQLQSALTALHAGDVLELEAGTMYTGNFTFPALDASASPVLIRSSRYAELPPGNARITASYVRAGLLPMINTSAPSAAVLDMQGIPTKSIYFLGIAFTSTYNTDGHGNTAPYELIMLGTGSPTSDNDLADDIQFDRCYFGALDGSPYHEVHRAMFITAKRVKVVNSYFNTYYTQQDGQCIAGTAAKGPITFENNYCGSGNAEGIIFGGSGNAYTGGGLTQGLSARNNLFVNSLRWYASSTGVTNPWYNSVSQQCMKNVVESKHGDYYRLFYNSGENQWSTCGNQWYGLSGTASSQTSYDLAHDYVRVGTAYGKVTLQGDHITLSFAAPTVSLNQNQYIGLPVVTITSSNYTAAASYEWQRIVSVVGSTVTMDAAYVNANAISNCTTACTWSYTPDGDSYNDHYVAVGNVIRNVGYGTIFTGYDVGSTTPARVIAPGKNYYLTNNLFINDEYTLAGALRKARGIPNGIGSWVSGTKLLRYVHNSWYVSPNMTLNGIATSLGGSGTNDYTSLDGLIYKSNLQPYGNYGFKADGYNSGVTSINAKTVTTSGPVEISFNTLMMNSVAPTLYQPCSGDRVCAHNIFGTNTVGTTNPFPFRGNNSGSSSAVTVPLRELGDNDYSLAPATAVSVTTATAAGLAVITAAHPFQYSAASSTTASVDIKGGAGCWAAMNGRWVGVVASSTTFQVPVDTSACGSFSGQTITAAFGVINSGHDGRDIGIDPQEVPLIQYLKVVPSATGVLFSWRVTRPLANMVSQVEVSADINLYAEVTQWAPVADLDPAVHTNYIQDSINPNAVKSSNGTLRYFSVWGLTPATRYYYRIMSGGGRQTGSFVTLAAVGSTNPTMTISYKAALGTRARVRYGQMVSALTTGSDVACTSSCTLSVPTVSDRQIVWYVDELNDGLAVVRTSNPYVAMQTH